MNGKDDINVKIIFLKNIGYGISIDDYTICNSGWVKSKGGMCHISYENREFLMGVWAYTKTSNHKMVLHTSCVRVEAKCCVE